MAVAACFALYFAEFKHCIHNECAIAYFTTEIFSLCIAVSNEPRYNSGVISDNFAKAMYVTRGNILSDVHDSKLM